MPRYGLAIDSEVWLFQHFVLERSSSREVSLSLHGRARDSDFPTLYQIQPRTAFALNSWTWAGVNYSYFGIKTQDEGIENEDLFTNQHRLEAELQFRANVTDTIRYVARNRFEYLLNSDWNNVSERVRHRSQVLLAPGFIERISIISQIELFYDFESGRMNQTRTAPVGLRVSQGRWSLQAQPMIVHLKAPDSGWQPSLIGNIEVTYDFTTDVTTQQMQQLKR
jgi:hypothetical protein